MKLVLAALEDVAEGLRTEYEARDGKFHLKLEGDYPPLIAANAKVVEFRDTNIKLKQQVEELLPLKAKYEGIDADAARDALEKVKGLKKKGVEGADDVDSKLKQMLDDAMKPVREQLAAAEAASKADKQRADDLTFTTLIGGKAKAIGAQDSAIEFLATKARADFDIKDGVVAPKTGKFSREKPGDPLSVEEWLKDTAIAMPFAFEPSKGGGAEGGKKPGDTKPGLKPGQTLLKNPTPQELGAAAADIIAGKVKVEYEAAAT